MFQASGATSSPRPVVTSPLGLSWRDGERDVPVIRVASEHASSVELCLFSPDDPSWVRHTYALHRDPRDPAVWAAIVPTLRPGDLYMLRAAGPGDPQNGFDPGRLLLDPYARGLVRFGHEWRCQAVEDGFDWGDTAPLGRPLDKTVIYEAHLKGLTKLHPEVPPEQRGTYAGMGHPAVIAHLTGLGVTAVELLPIHAFANEPRLRSLGLTNYWGYNTLGFFAPHPKYATAAAQAAGAAAINDELKGAIRALHAAGIEVLLDVVYNHTAEGNHDGPCYSFKGLDAATYYRQDELGRYQDTTGCGNSVNASKEAVQRLVVDSLRHWAEEYHVDGFRFDLATTLARGVDNQFDPGHPLIRAITDDPVLSTRKLIAEPWDVGYGGWRTGQFPNGWSEWNDGYRDTLREFWLSNLAAARVSGTSQGGIGKLAGAIAGSSATFSEERGPLASVNFVTAHDGFTLHDLVSYNAKHNYGNGESNRDGSDHNRSYNHGVEGPTDDPAILADRRKSARNLMATLLFSSGVPMLTAGDESGRTQRGNNNAYCQDSQLTWLSWDLSRVQHDQLETTSALCRIRREHPALRPTRYAVLGSHTPNASQMFWYNTQGREMSIDDWNAPGTRTLQYFAVSTPVDEALDRVLVVFHGCDDAATVTLPEPDDVDAFELLWNSAWERPDPARTERLSPGDELHVTGNSIVLLHAVEAA